MRGKPGPSSAADNKAPDWTGSGGRSISRRERAMSNQVERFCAGAGIIAALGFGTALYIAGFMPPTTPSMSATDVKDLILGNATAVKIGSILMLICLTGFVTFYTGIALQM